MNNAGWTAWEGRPPEVLCLAATDSAFDDHRLDVAIASTGVYRFEIPLDLPLGFPGMHLMFWRSSCILAIVCLCHAARLYAQEGDPAFTPAVSIAQPVDFVRDVMPALTRAGCNAGACHGSFQGRGGFTLSLLGFDPAADYETLFHTSRARRVFAALPEQSLLLRKASGAMPHGGGRRLTLDSYTGQLIVKLLAQGEPTLNRTLAVTGLRVEPADVILAPDEIIDLRVTAEWSDGVTRDVTQFALFDSRDPDTADVTKLGRVTTLKPGRAAITVRYMGQVASVGVSVPVSGTPPYELTVTDPLDQLLLNEWRKMGLVPAPLADDYEFLRRVSLDLTGTLPTPDEIREFAAETAADKRARVVDRLLETPAYVDYWSLKWSDLLRLHRRYLGERGLESAGAYVRTAVRENRPLDQMTRELLTAQGNLFSNGAVALYIVDEKPEDLAETVAQVFLGVRLQCTRCHHHPMEVWSQADYYGLAAFFTRLESKQNGDQGRFGGTRILKVADQEMESRKLKVAALPRVLGGTDISEFQGDVREILADWVTTKENPFFARNFANRLWAAMLGRGLVEPVDDLRATNPALVPAVLELLAHDFAASGFDQKGLLRRIAKTRAYQSASDLAPATTRNAELFTHRVPRRLPAEVLLDAVNQVCEVHEGFDGLPEETRAVALPDPSIPSYFLTTFGRPQRNNPCECARGGLPDLSQALHLANSESLQTKLANAKGRLARLVAANTSDAEMITELYLAALSRPPTADELQACQSLLGESTSKQEGLEDLTWTLLNLPEFSFSH